MTCPEPAWPELNVTGACACRPATTFRPPGSLVVVSVTLTLSPAANAGCAQRAPLMSRPALANRQPSRRRRRWPEVMVGMTVVPFERDARSHRDDAARLVAGSRLARPAGRL